jgi:hypothetical protein
MLAEGNLVRLLLVASHRRDTLLDLTGGKAVVSCHFNQADETFCNDQARLSVSASSKVWSGRTGRAKRGQLLFPLHSLQMSCPAAVEVAARCPVEPASLQCPVAFQEFETEMEVAGCKRL